MGKKQLGKLAADALPARVFRGTGERRVFRSSGVSSAAELLGQIVPGDEICGLTNGQFSLVDIVEHLLTCAGPSDITIATWTMGIYDTDRALAFARNGLIRSIRFVLDPSMFSRRPEIASILVRGFGPESFRGVNCHAKFCTIRSERLAVCVRSSMNLNPNNRIESFDLSADDETTRFFETFVDDVWNKIDQDNKSQSREVFDSLLSAKSARGSKRPNPFLDAAA